MLYDDPDAPTYFLWRFMIDQRSGRGYGAPRPAPAGGASAPVQMPRYWV